MQCQPLWFSAASSAFRSLITLEHFSSYMEMVYVDISKVSLQKLKLDEAILFATLCNSHCDQFQDRMGWLSKFKKSLPQFEQKIIIHKTPD